MYNLVFLITQIGTLNTATSIEATWRKVPAQLPVA